MNMQLWVFNVERWGEKIEPDQTSWWMYFFENSELLCEWLWRGHVCEAYAWHDSLVRVTIHSYEWHDSFKGVGLDISAHHASGVMFVSLTHMSHGTADPTWGDIFECCFKAQSSKLENLFSLKRGNRDVRALSVVLSEMSP